VKLETITPLGLETMAIKQTETGTGESPGIKQIEDPPTHSKEK